jgi:threonyl-tRNA synthetase
LRVKLDLENRTLQQKIAIHSTEKIPYLLIIGDKEKESKSISIRIFSSSENSKLISMKVDEFIKKVIDKVNKKSISFEL